MKAKEGKKTKSAAKHKATHIFCFWRKTPSEWLNRFLAVSFFFVSVHVWELWARIGNGIAIQFLKFLTLIKKVVVLFDVPTSRTSLKWKTRCLPYTHILEKEYYNVSSSSRPSSQYLEAKLNSYLYVCVCIHLWLFTCNGLIKPNFLDQKKFIHFMFVLDFVRLFFCVSLNLSDFILFSRSVPLCLPRFRQKKTRINETRTNKLSGTRTSGGIGFKLSAFYVKKRPTKP